MRRTMDSRIEAKIENAEREMAASRLQNAFNIYYSTLREIPCEPRVLMGLSRLFFLLGREEEVRENWILAYKFYATRLIVNQVIWSHSRD